MNFLVVLLTGLFVSGVGATDQDALQLVKQNLAEAHSKFVALRDSGMVNYKTKFDKERFQSKIDLIPQSQALIAGDDADFTQAHKFASEAVIGISGLKTAGSIGIVKAEARELYVKGYVALRDAVVTLYHLKTAQSGRLVGSDSRFVLTDADNGLEVSTYDAQAGVVSTRFNGFSSVMESQNSVVLRNEKQCLSVSYLDEARQYLVEVLECSSEILKAEKFDTLHNK